MWVAVVSAPSQRQPPPDYVKALAKGIESAGHRVDVFNAWTDDGMRLPGYEYIVIVTEPLSFFSAKVSEALLKILGASSGIGGKKSAAFVKKSGLRTNKTLANVMNVMEKEGMLINWCDILFNAPHAEAMGKHIGA